MFTVDLQETIAMPFLTLLADFREEVRKRALEVKGQSALHLSAAVFYVAPSSLPDPGLLRVCDEVRDQKLGDLGVRMEDKEEGTVVKMVGRAAILREREREREVSCSWSCGQEACNVVVLPWFQAMEERLRAKAEQKRKLEEAKVRGRAGRREDGGTVY